MRPKVTKMIFNVISHSLAQSNIVPRVSCQKYQPVIKISTLVWWSHISFHVCNNLDEVTHNIRKEGHSTKLNDQGDEPFLVANWIIVSITHCTQCGQSKVTTYDQLMDAFFVLQVKFLDESVCVFKFSVYSTEQEPEATNEVSQDDSDEDKTHHFVDLKHLILHYDLIVTRSTAR